jgi:hypothetical protein
VPSYVHALPLGIASGIAVLYINVGMPVDVFETVIVTVALVPTFPLGSWATAVNV